MDSGQEYHELLDRESEKDSTTPAGDTAAGRVVVGLDIGGTKTAALVVDGDQRQLSQVNRPTVIADPDKLVSGIAKTVREALALAQVDSDRLEGIGIAVPGLVNPSRGLVELAVNLNLERYPLGQALSTELGAPTYLENDVRTAAVGAYEYVRREETIQHIAYLSIGTGIAAGIILNGQLYRGAHGMAGEIGHVIFEPDGPICGCDMPGCLEAVASGSAIARMGQQSMPAYEGAVTAETVYGAARRGDKSAKRIVERTGRYLSRAIQLLIMAYDVEKVVLGGGVTKAGPAFLDPILHELSHLRSQSTLANAMLSAGKVMMLPADYNAGVWGAVKLALDSKQHTLTFSRLAASSTEL